VTSGRLFGILDQSLLTFVGLFWKPSTNQHLCWTVT